MGNAMISPVRMRVLAALGRSRLAKPGGAGLHEPCAAHGRADNDASSIAADAPARPRTPRTRPAASDLTASPTS